MTYIPRSEFNKKRFESLRKPLEPVEWILLILTGTVAGFGLGLVLAIKYLL